MQNFMVDTLTTSSHSPQGCGMSTHPGYYSGRGATQTDLNSTKLEKIYQSILKNKGKAAGNAFVRMVESIKVMSATNFLIALEDFDACDYRLNDSAKMPAQDGISIENEGEEIGTIMSVLAGSRNRDETKAIKFPFLIQRGAMKQSDYDPYETYSFSKGRY